MNVTIRIPTKEYAFVELQLLDVPAEEVKDVYDEWVRAFEKKDGLPTKDFNRFLDAYVTTGKPPNDGQSLWQDMNEQQKMVIDEVKKSIKRLNKN